MIPKEYVQLYIIEKTIKIHACKSYLVRQIHDMYVPGKIKTPLPSI